MTAIAPSTRGLSAALAKCLGGRTNVISTIDVREFPGVSVARVDVSLVLSKRKMRPLVEWFVKQQSRAARAKPKRSSRRRKK